MTSAALKAWEAHERRRDVGRKAVHRLLDQAARGEERSLTKIKLPKHLATAISYTNC